MNTRWSVNRLGNLNGKRIIVTGATNGVGLATARSLARAGAQVILAVRNLELGAQRAAEMGGDTSVVKLDLADQASVRAFPSLFDGEVDILINNAGVSANALGEATTDAQWDNTFAVNARAVFRLCRAAIPALRERAAVTGRARIINTASVMAERTDIGLSAYTASKHAVAGLSKTLALELGKWGITVNYLLPGAIQTGMTAASFQDEKIRAVWAKKAALRRLGQPIDMARSVLLLASDEADFITGHGLVADGGLTLRT